MVAASSACLCTYFFLFLPCEVNCPCLLGGLMRPPSAAGHTPCWLLYHLGPSPWANLGSTLPTLSPHPITVLASTKNRRGAGRRPGLGAPGTLLLEGGPR